MARVYRGLEDAEVRGTLVEVEPDRVVVREADGDLVIVRAVGLLAKRLDALKPEVGEVIELRATGLTASGLRDYYVAIDRPPEAQP